MDDLSPLCCSVLYQRASERIKSNQHRSENVIQQMLDYPMWTLLMMSTELANKWAGQQTNGRTGVRNAGIWVMQFVSICAHTQTSKQESPHWVYVVVVRSRQAGLKCRYRSQPHQRVDEIKNLSHQVLELYDSKYATHRQQQHRKSIPNGIYWKFT